MILRLRRSPKRFNNFILFHIGAVCLRTYRQSTLPDHIPQHLLATS